MTIRQPRYSKEEFAQRGDALYEAQIRSQVEEGNHGKIVAIDLETLRLIRVKLLLAIASKLVTLTLKSGLSVLVPAMFVDLADARRELYDYRNCQCGL
jgi:hypothetical protein